MPTCPKCGAEAEKNDEFCRVCGTRLVGETGEPVERKRYSQERDVCFGEGERYRDYSGLVSFGVFLLMVGIIFLVNPNLISDFRSWVDTMRTQETLLRPTQGVIDSATLFFALVGISNFFIASIRFMAHQRLRRVLTSILSGVALVSFSYFIYLYGTHALAWQMTLAAEAIVCGLLIILYSILRYMFPKKL